MRTQASLGKVHYQSRIDLNNGVLSLGKVKKIYEKTNSVDVLMLTNNYLGDNKEDDGIVSCYRLESYCGYDEDLKVSYGKINPIHEGSLVVVGYIDGMKGQPILLGTLPYDLDDKKLNTPIENANGEDILDTEESLEVSRLQDYNYYNRFHEHERASNNRSFFVARKEKVSDYRESQLRYEDLSIKNKMTRDTLGLKEEQYDFKPFNYLISTKNKYSNKGAIFNRFYHDAEKGITRFSKDSDERTFYVEVDSNDNFTIRMQKDSWKRKKGIGEPTEYEHNTLRQSDQKDLKKFPREQLTDKSLNHITQIKYTENGDMIFTYQLANSDNITQLKIAENGIEVNTTENVIVNSKKNISVQSEQTISIKSNSSISLVAPSISSTETNPGINLQLNDLIEKE